MNIFAQIVEYEIFDLVTYYSVQSENDELCEMDKFVQKFIDEEEYQEDFNIIISIIIEMGERRRAKEKWFRPENEAHALPPPTQEVKHFLIDKIGNYQLRLYCIWLSENIVILLNGDVKNAQTIQESTSQLYDKFLFARKVGKVITDKLSYPKPELFIKNHTLEGDFELIL